MTLAEDGDQPIGGTAVREIRICIQDVQEDFGPPYPTAVEPPSSQSNQSQTSRAGYPKVRRAKLIKKSCRCPLQSRRVWEAGVGIAKQYGRGGVPTRPIGTATVSSNF